MATAAILTGWNTNAFRRSQKIHTFNRQPGQTLGVNSGVIVTNQAVDIGLVFKIEICVIPSVTRMTGRAGRPVALDTNAEVVDGFLLAGCI